MIHGKYQYNYEDFYKASGAKGFDIFICKENGKQYVPCGHSLQEYAVLPEKSKSNIAVR